MKRRIKSDLLDFVIASKAKQSIFFPGGFWIASLCSQ